MIDARSLASAEQLNCDLCIVGGGPAGITLALALEARGLDIVLLEGGGTQSDPASQVLYAGDVVGERYDSLDLARSRFLGGSTNCWGGLCRPLEPLDFERRDWVGLSGWPIGQGDLRPYLQQTHDMLELGPLDYDPQSWAARLGVPADTLTRGETDDVRTTLGLLTAPTRFGQVYHDRLRRSTSVKLILNATVRQLRTDEGGTKVTSLDVVSLEGTPFAVNAGRVVLAAGGIENPRLLLASNSGRSAGIGNEHDWVGRCFMDHLRFTTTRVSLRLPELRPYLDNAIYLMCRPLRRKYLPFVTQLTPSPGAQERKRLPNSRTYLVADYFPALADGYTAALNMLRELRHAAAGGVSPAERIRRIMGQVPTAADAPLAAIRFGADLARNFAPRSQGYRLETVMEPVPNKDSRVTLSDRKDRFGVPQARLDWRLHADDRAHFARLMTVLSQQAAGLVGFAEGVPSWPDQVKWCWHHMGTTRMSRDPRDGVVDADCRVHGMANLYVAGSSVFPTVGADCPTINIVALALRLADHLAEAQPIG